MRDDTAVNRDANAHREEIMLLIESITRHVSYTVSRPQTWGMVGDLERTAHDLLNIREYWASINQPTCRNCGQSPCRPTCVLSYPAVQMPKYLRS